MMGFKVSSSYPEKNDIDVLDPKKFGDDWDQELKKVNSIL